MLRSILTLFAGKVNNLLIFDSRRFTAFQQAAFPSRRFSNRRFLPLGGSLQLVVRIWLGGKASINNQRGCLVIHTCNISLSMAFSSWEILDTHNRGATYCPPWPPAPLDHSASKSRTSQLYSTFLLICAIL